VGILQCHFSSVINIFLLDASNSTHSANFAQILIPENL